MDGFFFSIIFALRQKGYFRVNGHATFTACDNDKIHDSFPGLGGAIYNGVTGSILFKGGVTVQDMVVSVRFNRVI